MGRFFFGVELHEYYDAKTILDEIELGERLGYDAVWLGDSQMIWREMYVLLGAAARATSRVLLGTGVTNPITRLPVVTASAITTLAMFLSTHGNMTLPVFLFQKIGVRTDQAGAISVLFASGIVALVLLLRFAVWKRIRPV